MKERIASSIVPKILLVLNVLILMVYFAWWFFFDHVKNPWLYGALFAGEIYHVVMALTFWFTVRRQKQSASFC